MQIDEFDYELPEQAIAQVPLADRSSARLLVGTDPIAHRTVRDLPSMILPGDVIVVNNTRVLPARLRLFKETGGKVEVFLLSPVGDGSWEALVRPSRRVPDGTVLTDGKGDPIVTVLADRGEGRRLVAPATETSMLDLAASEGEMPLPPYIHSHLADPERYQTVYADTVGSVAAPTAGLHFTDALIAECEASGAMVVDVELRVGIGTFRPIVAHRIVDHQMHAERYHVPASTWQACRDARRVIAIGTTSVRALESAAVTGELDGETELFIHPGYDWQIVDALLTNFHMPKSSLLVMLAAFYGPGWRSLYSEALSSDYRFLSFGDAMFVERQAGPEAENPREAPDVSL